MTNITLINADCIEYMANMPSESVDIIITDPPYKKEYNHLYGKMAEQAKRVLFHGGLLLTLSGHHSLDVIMADMTKHLNFYWMGGMPNWAGSVARYHPRQMMMGWKPCIWFSKGKARKHDYVFDLFQVQRIERTNHEWEQPMNWFIYYIRKLTRLHDVILDPFMGSGTVGIAAVRAERSFIGIEIDPQYYSVAQERIEQEKSQLHLSMEDVNE